MPYPPEELLYNPELLYPLLAVFAFILLLVGVVDDETAEREEGEAEEESAEGDEDDDARADDDDDDGGNEVEGAILAEAAEVEERSHGFAGDDVRAAMLLI